ncbi:hypothetical protein ACWEOI_12690 [Nocardia sp. NPDC004340]
MSGSAPKALLIFAARYQGFIGGCAGAYDDLDGHVRDLDGALPELRRLFSLGRGHNGREVVAIVLLASSR